jgi:hypothetical protein
MSSSSHGWPGGWGGPGGLLLGPVLGDGVPREAAGHEVVLDELALGLHQVDALQRLLFSKRACSSQAWSARRRWLSSRSSTRAGCAGDGVGLLEGPRLGDVDTPYRFSHAPIVGRLIAP